WTRINHPNEVLDLDQSIKVVILDFDDDKSKIQLGLKQLTDHPWDKLESDIEEGSKVSGKVVVIADYGAFIEVQDGIEGLVHVSEMSWSTHLRSAQDFVKVGDTIEAIVLTLDKDSRKMSLGIKQLTVDPWSDITSKFPVGSKHKGKVRNFTNFGVFIELEEGIDGLIYISDLSWSKKIKHPSEFLSINDIIDVIILDLDVEGRKLSLGHKQTKENPWDLYEKDFALDTIHNAKISEIVEKGAIINFNDDISAFIPYRHLDKPDGSKLVKGELADFVVIEFNKEFKRVLVSHLLTHNMEVKEEKPEKEVKKTKSTKSKKKEEKPEKEVKKTKSTKSKKKDD
ncbi:MAG: S1 RNA-binding domain-containing protein, partial [Flavobacteriales bacterium]